jgi:hypothetical protein
VKLEPAELEEKGYVLLEKMDHSALVPFVKKFMNKRTWASSIYYLSIVLSFSLLVFLCMKVYRSGNHTASKIPLHMSLGAVFILVLIPLHEFIHATVYKLRGARKTSFDMNLKKFYFLALADQFVASRREFRMVALAPFLVISSVLLAAALFTGVLWSITMLTTLMIHSALCSGDFALLSYFEYNKQQEVVTYDDKESKISFFYGKKK